MKMKQLIIKNIGKITHMTIPIDKPLVLFYGDLCQGKTTILNAVKMLFGGGYPSDVIRHGEEEGSVTLEFDNGSISREWYHAKNGKVSDRPISFILNGKPVKKPVEAMKEFLNPYLLDAEFLLKMKETDQTKYFTELFAVDTSELDKERSDLEEQGRDLRAKIKAYGEIDTTPVVLLDIQSARSELDSIKSNHAAAVEKFREGVAAIRKSHREQVELVVQRNRDALERDNQIDRCQREIAEWHGKIKEFEDNIRILKNSIERADTWLKENPSLPKAEIPEEPATPPEPEMPDVSELEAKISQGEANKVLYDEYQKRLNKAAEKAADEKLLKDVEDKWRDNKKRKIAKLKEVDTGGIQALSFDESGNFTYEGVQAGMLSTSQIMRLSGELSSLYPKGFGLELIDRAESLGKSIFGFIERAQREEKSILATIVGEKPAEVPEHVGVWVVEEGSLK